MIRAEFFSLPLIYATAVLAIVLLLWLGYEWRRARRRRREFADLDQCRLCAEWIRRGEKVALWRCPSCGALNEPAAKNPI
jgi:hypothetical protein